MSSRSIDRLESCGSEPSLCRVALALRIARRDSWSAIHERIRELAAQKSLSSFDYVLCLRESVAYDPVEGVRALAGLLRLRPGLSRIDVAQLLDRSMGWVPSADQVIDLLDDGALHWDRETLRLRQ
jgi:hypothetical protein